MEITVRSTKFLKVPVGGVIGGLEDTERVFWLWPGGSAG